MTTFSKRLKQLREQRGYTQAQIGQATSVSPQAVQHWEKENGKPPRGQRLQVLADFLGTTVEWLMTGKHPNAAAETYNQLINHADKWPQARQSETYTVPILEFSTAAQQPHEWKPHETIGTAGTALKHSKLAFAVFAPNNNMYNPDKDIFFKRGDILIIEPGIKPIDGDFVFACTNPQEQTGIIAQMQINPATGTKMLYLTGETTISPNPFNLPDHAFICGTITERKTRIIDEATIKARLK